MTRQEIRKKYTAQEIEEIYRYQEFMYTVEDARFHIEEFVDWRELSREE